MKFSILIVYEENPIKLREIIKIVLFIKYLNSSIIKIEYFIKYLNLNFIISLIDFFLLIVCQKKNLIFEKTFKINLNYLK